jgi:hypothetical protein
MRNSIIILSVGLAIFITGFVMLIQGCGTPETREEIETRLTYEITGSYDHQAYIIAEEGQGKANPKQFAKIVDNITVSYNYQFIPSEPVLGVNGQAEISAIVRSPGMWEKEVEILPARQTMGDFSTSFTLEPSYYLQLAADISNQIGITTSSPQVVLKATIYTEVETEEGVLKETFVQTLNVDLKGTVYEWNRPFTMSRKGYWEGMTYEQKGSFGYAVQLKSNILFGAATIYSNIQEEPPTMVARSAEYDAETIETLEVTLSNLLESDGTVTNISNDMEVNAVLDIPGSQKIPFRLVPQQNIEGKASITFPLDIGLYYDIIEADKTRNADADAVLTVQADINTVARSDYGVIDKSFSPTLKILLGPESLTWPLETEKTISDSFWETVTVPNKSRGTAITGALSVMGISLAALLYGGWSFRQARIKSVPVPKVEQEAIQAKKQHKDIIVDVMALPPRGGQVLIPVDSLDELVKVADALLKPVLHKGEPDKHTYYVTDGLTLYEYISLEYPEFDDKK